MSRCNVIVVGASAGGVDALLRLVGGLPADLEAAVAVALHTPEHSPSVLPRLLTRNGALEAQHAHDGEPLVHHRIYVAPPGRHLLTALRALEENSSLLRRMHEQSTARGQSHSHPAAITSRRATMRSRTVDPAPPRCGKQ